MFNNIVWCIRFSRDTSVGPKPSFSSKSEGEHLKSNFSPATSPPALSMPQKQKVSRPKDSDVVAPNCVLQSLV